MKHCNFFLLYTLTFSISTPNIINNFTSFPQDKNRTYGGNTDYIEIKIIKKLINMIKINI